MGVWERVIRREAGSNNDGGRLVYNSSIASLLQRDILSNVGKGSPFSN